MIEKIKNITFPILAIGFITLVVFYKPNIHALNIDNSASIGDQIELQPTNDWGEVKKEEVVYYGTLYRYSTSGALGFYFYNIERNQLDQPDNPQNWFWAGPKDIKNEEEINKILDVINKNPGAIFKITGTRNSDDIGYYQDGTPVQDITIKEIEVYKK